MQSVFRLHDLSVTAAAAKPCAAAGTLSVLKAPVKASFERSSKSAREGENSKMLPLSTTEEEAMWTIGTGWWFMHLKQTTFLQQVLQVFPAIVFISVSGSSSFFFSDLFDLQDQTQ